MLIRPQRATRRPGGQEGDRYGGQYRLAQNQATVSGVSRERYPAIYPEQAIDIETPPVTRCAVKKSFPKTGRSPLYCYHTSPKARKKRPWPKRFCESFEAALGAIADGLSRPAPKTPHQTLGSASADSKEKSTASASTTYRTTKPTRRKNSHETDLDEVSNRRRASSPIRRLLPSAAMRPPGMPRIVAYLHHADRP